MTPYRAAPLALALLAAGCATTQLSPNRHLEAGEVIVSGSGDLQVTPPFPSRVAAVATAGFGVGDVQAVASMQTQEQGHLMLGARFYAGPVNAGLRLGASYDFAEVGCADAWCPVWDLRLTTASSTEQPFYFGLHDSGILAREPYWGDRTVEQGPLMRIEPRSRAGLLVGYERWWTHWGVQVELDFNLLEWRRGELGFLGEEGASDVSLPGTAQILQLGVGLHYDLGG